MEPAGATTDLSTGGCLCGKVRYQLSGSPRRVSICYCLDCRQASGAPGVAWVSVRREDFVALAGELKQVRHARRLRSFATCCGTPILVEDAANSPRVEVTTCSMDHPDAYPPIAAIWTEDRLPWTSSIGGLPEFPRDREQGEVGSRKGGK